MQDGGVDWPGAADERRAPLAVGIFLYLLYLIRIGGDYMSGPFLSVPFFCAVLLLCGPAGTRSGDFASRWS